MYADRPLLRWTDASAAPGLHIVEDRAPDWPQLLAFRDHLRDHPADAAEYARRKAALAAADDRDRPRYRAGKAPFITELLGRLDLKPR